MGNEAAPWLAHKAENDVHFVFRQARAEHGDMRDIFSLRFKVYCLERGFLPAADYKDELESDEYDRCSTHFGAYNRNSQITGTVRLVRVTDGRPFPFQLHCDSLFENFRMPPAHECGEVSRLIVDKAYRRRQGDTPEGVSTNLLNCDSPLANTGADRRNNSPEIVLGLYRQMYQYAIQNEIRYWFAAMEVSLARVLGRLGFMFKPIGLETNYYGPVTPYIADLREIEQMLTVHNPALLAWFRQPPA